MTATNGTLGSIERDPALRIERRLSHDVDRVWRAISEPAELAQWWVAPVSWTPAVGEVLSGFGQTGAVTVVDPPRRLAWTWGAERFSFDLRPDGDGCLLVFTHVLAQREPAAQHAAGWECYFDRLDAALAGSPMSVEAAHDPIAEMHERYAAAFELDPAAGRRTIAGMAFRDLTLEDEPDDDLCVLRLARRYKHPVQRIWRAVTEPDELAHWFPGGAPDEIVEERAPELLVCRWYGDLLRIELRPDGDGCMLVFTHEFDGRELSARTAAGWDRCFARFDALLAGSPLDEKTALELWPLVHERYAERFEVDPEIGRRAFAAHPLT